MPEQIKENNKERIKRDKVDAIAGSPSELAARVQITGNDCIEMYNNLIYS